MRSGKVEGRYGSWPEKTRKNDSASTGMSPHAAISAGISAPARGRGGHGGGTSPAMDLSALISTQICLIVSSPVADSGDTLVNVGLRGMPLDPRDPNSICSFFGNCFKEVLPKIPITDEPPAPGHFAALAEKHKNL